MKTLFCIIGNLRGGKVPYESYKRYFKNKNIDLLLCIGNTYSDSEWRQEAKYIYEIDESNNNVWENIYDEVSDSWKQENWLPENVWGPYNGRSGSGMIICAFRKKLYDFIIANNLCYDRYVMTRSDHYYISDFLPEVKSNCLYIPQGEDYEGVTDRFLVADHKSFLMSLRNIVDFVISNPQKYTNIEQYLKNYYLSMNLDIHRIKRTMYCIGRADEQTRWRKPKIEYPVPNHPEYYLKYPAEYELITST
jgi:hypothetical protein